MNRADHQRSRRGRDPLAGVSQPRNTVGSYPKLGAGKLFQECGKVNPAAPEREQTRWRERAFGVDPSGRCLVPLKANFRTQPGTERVIDHDADVQTPESQAEEQTWVPGPNADQGGPQDPKPASPTWPASLGSERRLEVGSSGMAHPVAGAPGSFRLPPGSRITRTRDIRALLRNGRRKKTSHLDVFFLSSGASLPRLGLVVPKHRRRIVDRNRLKRRLREIGRRELLPRLREEGLGLDVLVRARREAYGVGYGQLRQELMEMIEELCSGPASWR